MGRRPNPFSKRSQNAFKKQSPSSKIGVGIFAIILSVVFLIITIVLNNSLNVDYLIAYCIIFGVAPFLIGGIIAIAIGVSENREQREFEENASKTNFAQIDTMSGKTFERFLGAILKKHGYDVSFTKTSGDYGVDLILHKNFEKIIVQAKCYKNKVPISAVQEISAARSYYDTNTAWVITNNYFTQPAINLANANGIKLIDRKELAALVSAVHEQPEEISTEALALYKSFSNTTALSPTKGINEGGQKIIQPSEVLQKTIQENDYNRWISSQLFDLKNEIIALYAKFDFEEISKKIKQAESYDYKTQKSKSSLHFFYQDIIGIVYALRYKYENAIEDCLVLCDKDIALLPEIGLSNITVYSLTRKAIVLEQRNELQKAIDLCDFAIEHNYLDNGKPFILRKMRLLKKQEKTKSNE